MTEREERKLYEALRGPILYHDREVIAIMDATAVEDLHAIAPVVEEMIRNAEARGRLQLLLELNDEYGKFGIGRGA
jgi:hypothetical protein